jgi:hypothetical protein
MRSLFYLFLLNTCFACVFVAAEVLTSNDRLFRFHYLNFQALQSKFVERCVFYVVRV